MLYKFDSVIDPLIGVGFLEKNRDTLSADLLQVIQASSFKFITSMFKEDFSAVCKNCLLAESDTHGRD